MNDNNIPGDQKDPLDDFMPKENKPEENHTGGLKPLGTSSSTPADKPAPPSSMPPPPPYSVNAPRSPYAAGASQPVNTPQPEQQPSFSQRPQPQTAYNPGYQYNQTQQGGGMPPYPPYQQPYSQGGYQQNPIDYSFSKPPKKKRSILFTIFIIFFIGGILLFAGMFFIGIMSTITGKDMPIHESSVGVIEVIGTIGDETYLKTDDIIENLDKFGENSRIKSVVVRINSPGGTVGASQEIYDAIIDFKKKHRKPVVVSMGDLAASGGYYIAAAADEIYANKGTLTGSISVILNLMNAEGLLDKVGLKFDNVKSGKYKDIGSATRPMTEEEKQILSEVILDVHKQFVDAILDTREKKILDAMKKYNENVDITKAENTVFTLNREGAVEFMNKVVANGRIFSGQQAVELGLVDSLGGYQEAINYAAKKGGIVGKPNVVKPRKKVTLSDILSGEAKLNLLHNVFSSPSLEYKFTGK